jgi:glutamyl-tRNA synthetase
MGYSLPDGTEIFTFSDLVATFDWSRVNTVGPVFDLDKLNWLNGHYIRALPVEEFADRMLDHLAFSGVLSRLDDEQLRRVRAISPHIQERISHLAEAYAMIAFLLCSTEELTVDGDAVAALGAAGPSVLRAAYEALAPLSGWDAASIEAALRAALVDGLQLKPKLAFTPVRLAVTGQRISPPLFESIEVLGREETLARLQALEGRLRDA